DPAAATDPARVTEKPVPERADPGRVSRLLTMCALPLRSRLLPVRWQPEKARPEGWARQGRARHPAVPPGPAAADRAAPWRAEVRETRADPGCLQAQH